MFENLQDRLSGSLRKISGQARLTDDNIKDTLREVRMALLEADVALPVVKAFIEGVRERAIGCTSALRGSGCLQTAQLSAANLALPGPIHRAVRSGSDRAWFYMCMSFW